MKITKRAEAKATGATRYFTGRPCLHGHVAERLTSDGGCITCTLLKTAKRRADPETIKSDNEKSRVRMAERRRDDPGPAREGVAAVNWRGATKATAMPASYAVEREEMQRRYAAMAPGHHMDHRIPKKAKDLQGNHVASGLHTLSNLQPVPGRLNSMKSTYFDSDNFRDQRPANAHPGGAWDPVLTEEEWALVELLVRHYGHDRDATVQDIQALIARQHESYLQTNAA